MFEMLHFGAGASATLQELQEVDPLQARWRVFIYPADLVLSTAQCSKQKGANVQIHMNPHPHLLQNPQSSSEVPVNFWPAQQPLFASP